MRQPACLDHDFHVGRALEITCQYDVNEEARNILLLRQIAKKGIGSFFCSISILFFSLSFSFFISIVLYISNISREIISFVGNFEESINLKKVFS